ncbi:hypothetical protein ABZP36_019019 [Zizania latifolia]
MNDKHTEQVADPDSNGMVNFCESLEGRKCNSRQGSGVIYNVHPRKMDHRRGETGDDQRELGRKETEASERASEQRDDSEKEMAAAMRDPMLWHKVAAVSGNPSSPSSPSSAPPPASVA